MQAVLPKVFMSSAGDGSISQFWKGSLVLGLGFVFPDAGEQEILAIVNSIMVAAGSVWALYGLVMKLMRGRWSAIP